jgi:hypothetical protein
LVGFDVSQQQINLIRRFNSNVQTPDSPITRLLPDEWLRIIAQAQKLIRQGRASDVSEKRRGTYLCVYDRHGARYTVGREQRVLHLLGPSGEVIANSENLDVIIDALNSSLQR